MRTIYKYNLPIDDRATILMPQGAEILTAQMQGQGLYVWALVEPKRLSVVRHFEIYGTGHPISEVVERRYVGTVQQGSFVWHIFERLEK